MNKRIKSRVRATFALFLLGMGMYAGFDSLAEHALAERGLSTCGSADNPCAIAPLQVTTAAPGTLGTSPGASRTALAAS